MVGLLADSRFLDHPSSWVRFYATFEFPLIAMLIIGIVMLAGKFSLCVLRRQTRSLHSLRTRELRFQPSRRFSTMSFCASSTQRILFISMDGETTSSFFWPMAGNMSSYLLWMSRETISLCWLIDGVCHLTVSMGSDTYVSMQTY